MLRESVRGPVAPCAVTQQHLLTRFVWICTQEENPCPRYDGFIVDPASIPREQDRERYLSELALWWSRLSHTEQTWLGQPWRSRCTSAAELSDSPSG